MTLQPELFDLDSELDSSSTDEPLLERYRHWRLDRGASIRTASSEVSQLRALRRDLVSAGVTNTLRDVLERPQIAGRYLLEPMHEVSRSTIRTRYRALQRLLRFGVSPQLASGRITRLDASLGRRASGGWHDPGIMLGGQMRRTRRRATLHTSVLDGIVAAAIADSRESAALAALLCFTGIPLDDITRARWSELHWGSDALDCEVRLGTARDRRTYSVIRPGIAPIVRLRVERPDAMSDHFLFPGRRTELPVTPRAVSKRLGRWARSAGIDRVTRHGLTAALAARLSEGGVDDASIQQVLGLRWTKSVDSLLAPYRRIASQQQVQDVLERRLGADIA